MKNRGLKQKEKKLYTNLRQMNIPQVGEGAQATNLSRL